MNFKSIFFKAKIITKLRNFRKIKSKYSNPLKSFCNRKGFSAQKSNGEGKSNCKEECMLTNGSFPKTHRTVASVIS